MYLRPGSEVSSGKLFDRDDGSLESQLPVKHHLLQANDMEWHRHTLFTGNDVGIHGNEWQQPRNESDVAGRHFTNCKVRMCKIKLRNYCPSSHYVFVIFSQPRFLNNRFLKLMQEQIVESCLNEEPLGISGAEVIAYKADHTAVVELYGSHTLSAATYGLKAKTQVTEP